MITHTKCTQHQKKNSSDKWKWSSGDQEGARGILIESSSFIIDYWKCIFASITFFHSCFFLCPLQTPIQVVGRVGCDSHGKLNSQSVVLEGSRSSSAGISVPVNLAELKEYALFPGQVCEALSSFIFFIIINDQQIFIISHG
jgi:hypothetical protein